MTDLCRPPASAGVSFVTLCTWGLAALALLGLLIFSPSASAQVLAASEANLVLPDLRSQTFLGINGYWLLTSAW